MTTTINIKAIIITLIAAAVIMLAAMVMTHHSVSYTKVQLWQADSSWIAR